MNNYYQSKKTGRQIEKSVEYTEQLQPIIEQIQSDIKNITDSKAEKSSIPKNTSDLTDDTTQQIYDSKSTKPQSGQAVAEAIAGILGTAPENLDTLEELAKALNEDENFSATVLAEIAKKTDVGQKTYTGGEIFNDYERNQATGEFSHAEGTNVSASGNFAHAEGSSTKSMGVAAHGEGNSTRAEGNASHAEGYKTKTIGKFSHAEGRATISTGNGSHAEGNSTKATGLYSHSEGEGTTALGDYSHTEGYFTAAQGNYSHTEGCFTTAQGKCSHAEGEETSAFSLNTHSEGFQTRAGGYGYRIIEVSEKNPDGTGSYTLHTTEGLEVGMIYSINLSKDMAEVGKIVAINDNIVTVDNYKELSLNQANSSGRYQFNYLTIKDHPELGDINVGFAAHAEGENTIAHNKATHAEGWFTQAVGNYSHAENYSTVAGWSAHAEGRKSKALGATSHAEGFATIAEGDNQHVQGMYNIPDGTKAHILGNGSDEDNRSNAHTIDWEGNAWYAGKITLGAEPTNDNDVTTKKFVDKTISNTCANAIEQTVTGELISVTDSANDKLKGLKIFGKTIQDNIPTIVNPQELNSIGDNGSVNLSVCSKNVLKFPYTDTTVTKNGITWTVNNDGSITANGTATGNSNFNLTNDKNIAFGTYTFSVNYSDTSNISTNTIFAYIYVGDTYIPLLDKKTFKIDTTPSQFIINLRIMSGVTVNNLVFKPQLEFGTTKTDFEIYKGIQTISVSTANSLCGIPVTSGGNYTDSNGQQWVCDEVDFERGVHIQRMGQIESYDGEEIVTEYMSETGELSAGAKVIYVLAQPIETPLTDEEISAYNTLTTYKPTTTITNDEDVGIELSYAADTKTYIDNKFTELQNAITSLGGNL